MTKSMTNYFWMIDSQSFLEIFLCADWFSPSMECRYTDFMTWSVSQPPIRMMSASGTFIELNFEAK